MRCELTVLALLSALAAACSGERISSPPPPPVNWQSLNRPPPRPDAGRVTATETERAVADVYLNALAAPGIAGLAPILDDEAHFRFAGTSDVRGRDEVVRAHNAFFGVFGDRRFVTTRVLRTNRSQTLEWTMTGVHAATHRPVTIRALSVLWTNDDGSLADVHLYVDQALVSAQIGEGPPALRSATVPPPPSGPPVVLEQTESAEENANVALVRSEIEALKYHHEGAYLATLAEDVAVTTLESAEPARGRTAARTYFRSLLSAIDNLDTSVENAWGFGTFVVIEYHITGRQLRPIGWIPLSRDPDHLVEWSVVDVVEIDHGRIARVSRYENPIDIESTP